MTDKMELPKLSRDNNNEPENKTKVSSSSAEIKPILFPKRFGLSKKEKFFYSIGHVFNDMVASMWFTYLLLFMHLVLKIPDVTSGLLLLVGQIADGLSTVFVGLESDHGCAFSILNKYGKRKSWHLIGTIGVAATFPFIFMTVIGLGNDGVSDLARFFYYLMFIIIFQFSWACVQISHLSLIPDLTECTNERTELNSYRYAWTIIANLIVYGVTWLVLTMSSKHGSPILCPLDASKFRTIVLIIVGVGIIFAAMFHLFVKERNSENSQVSNEGIGESSSTTQSKTWRCWLKQLSFYQIGLLYMSTRLFTNISQTFITLYCQETLKLPSSSIAYIPLLIFGSGFMSSFLVNILTARLGKKITYAIGCCAGISACIWFGLADGYLFKNYFIFVASVLLGIGTSTMLVTALGLVNDLIGIDTKSSAFVFGAMSFLDKLSNGGAIMAIQALHPCVVLCPLSGAYYRNILGYVCGASVVLSFIAIIILIPVKFETKVLTRPRKDINTSVNDDIQSITSSTSQIIKVAD